MPYHLDDTDTVSIRLGTLVLVRWLAILGQLIALMVVHFGLGFDARLNLTLPLVAVFAIFNLSLTLDRDRNIQLKDRKAAFQLGLDLVHLTALLFVTGGLMNPFAVLMLAPTSVSASILRQRSTMQLILLAVLCITALAFTPFSLPWHSPFPKFSPVYLAGIWFSLSLTLVFLGIYMGRIGKEGRHRTRALAATQVALEREQKLAAIGTLAAAAAHELGTPLGTIMLAARELADTCEPGSDSYTDLSLILEQTDRCRSILAKMSHHQQAEEDHFAVQPLEAILREAASPHEKRGVRIVFHRSNSGAQLHVQRKAELIHALRNIIENATGFARDQVDIHTDWNDHYIHVHIDDDGPGFDPQVLKKLGEPYITTREPTPGKDGGMGLGLFIAKTLLERTGASVGFTRSKSGGARIAIDWKRSDLEEKL